MVRTRRTQPLTPAGSDLRPAILAAIPSLRAFALSLTGRSEQADDLVQDTILRGLANLDRFEPGTNLQAWLFTILRNQFHSAYRKRRREVEDPEGLIAAKQVWSGWPTDAGRVSIV